MAECYGNQVASEGVSSTTVESTVVTSSGSSTDTSGSSIPKTVETFDNFKVGTLTKNLLQCFKDAANYYHIDWMWLAALAYCESGWNASAKNQLGYSYGGLCGFSQKTLNETIGKEIKNPDKLNARHQAMAAAKNMSLFMADARRRGFNVEEQYLYAGIAHNAGIGGANWAYRNANPRNIVGMQMALLMCDGGYGTHAWKCKWKGFENMRPTERVRQSTEKYEYPKKMKSAYLAICKKYKNA